MSSIGLMQQMVENPGMPIRQPSTAVFTVDTADRYRYNSNGQRVDTAPVNDIYINKQQTVINGYFTRVALTEFNMPWDIPNVNSRNNTFTIQIQVPAIEEITATVPEGFYNGTELATALQTALNAAIADVGAENDYDFTVVFDDTLGTFTINNIDADAAEWNIVPKNNGPRDDLTNMMGFGAVLKIWQDVPGITEWVSNTASMLYTPYFDIVSKQLTKKQQVGDSGTSYSTGQNLLARIYVSQNDITLTNFNDQIGTRPFTIHREFRVPKQIYWDTKEFINVVDLSLVDYKGNTLYESDVVYDEAAKKLTLGSGNANWQLTLQVSEV